MTNITGYSSYNSQYYSSSSSYSKSSDGSESFKSEIKSASTQKAAYYEKSDDSLSLATAYDKGMFGVSKNVVQKKSDSAQLSDKAQKLLEELKEKYSDMDVIIADFEEGKDYGGTHDYSLVISKEELERMAKDEDVKAKDLELVDKSIAELKKLNEDLTDEEKAEITSMGVSINSNGEVEFFAELTKLSERQKERIEEALKKKEQEKEVAAERVEKAKLNATSIEELLEKIRNHSWDDIEENSSPIELTANQI